MKRGIISVGEYDILSESEISFRFQRNDADNSKNRNMLKEKLGKRGFWDDRCENVLCELFDAIYKEFVEKFGRRIPIKLWEGYLSKERGTKYVKHNKEHRIYTEGGGVYVDILMSSVLYDYAATYYIWARFAMQSDIVLECFKQALYNFNECCRKGKLSGLEGSVHLIELENDNLEDWEWIVISDLYWCMLAFAICHEIAHEYMEHEDTYEAERVRCQEFEADKVGYDIFLRLMIKHMYSTEDKPTSVFREYLYTAPMILFLFYHDLFAVDSIMYGEERSGAHPTEEQRIEHLLQISQADAYIFDSVKGNIVLSNYYDVSDNFCNMLKAKLEEGALKDIIRKDADI